jgi:hypothetical protein
MYHSDSRPHPPSASPTTDGLHPAVTPLRLVVVTPYQHGGQTRTAMRAWQRERHNQRFDAEGEALRTGVLSRAARRGR